MNMGKLLVISRKFPPSTGGSQTLLKNLFKFFNSEEYVVVHDNEKIEEENELTYQGLRVDFPFTLRKILGKLSIPLYIFLIPFIVYKLLKLNRTEGIEKCLINYPDPFFSVAGYIFVKLINLEYVLYFHDLFEEAQIKSTRIVQRFLAKIFERRMIKDSRKFLVICRGLKDFYKDKYGVQPIILPHSIDLDIVNKNFAIDKNSESTRSKIIRIVYSGGVYDDQYDAMLSFVEAIRNSDLNVKLTITSVHSAEYFKKIGIADEDTEVRFFKNRKKVFELQRQADILYLPLAFDPPDPFEVKTALPTKIFEYIASMRPILIHCPADSFLSKFCRENKIGYVCNTIEKKYILVSIEKLTNSEYEVDYGHRVDFLRKYDRKRIAMRFREIIGCKKRM